MATLSMNQSIWGHDSQWCCLSSNKKEESWCKRVSMVAERPHNTIIKETPRFCRNPKTDNRVSSTNPPSALFKTRMCPRWLSGCYMGDRCHYGHHIEDLFRPFYTKEMIFHQERQFRLKIDSLHMPRLCKEICSTVCEDREQKCLFFGNNSMSNKRIQVHIPGHSSQIPYCTVTCNTCQLLKRIEIYSFMI